jgi:hypothetical protein
VEYDSTVDEGPLDGAFRHAGSVQVVGSGEWKTAEMTLRDCHFMNRCNGADFRLAVSGGQLELAIRRVQVEKTQ